MQQAMRALCLLALPIFCQMPLQAQECGTVPTPAQMEYLTKTRDARQAFDISQLADDRYGASIHWLPVQFHECIPTATAPYALREYSISQWLGQLNQLFLPYRIQFYECGSFQLFVSSTLHYFDNTEEPQLSAYDIPNVINIYAFGTVTVGGQSAAGYSYLPPSADRIILSKTGGLSDSKVLIHELGHYLGLYHTHGKTNLGLTDELVNGSNCLIAGDDVCDTPADPNLYTSSNLSCQYTGTFHDANNQVYTPDVSNHMSYAQKQCRNHFSIGQMNRMAYSAVYDRNYLHGCAHPSGCDQPITQLPHVFDFENGMDGWINKSYDGYGDFVDFVHGTGVSPAPNTGPDQAQSGTGYVHFDALSASPDGSGAVMISPCIDLRGVQSPKVTFHYHAYGAEIGEIGAQVSIDGGHTFQGNQNNNAIFYLTGGDQGNQWHSITCDLSAYKNAAALQIRLLVVGGPQGEIAFDSIAIYNDPGSDCSLSLTSEFLDVSCYGNANGQIYLAPFGQYVPPLSYSWSNGATTPYVSGLNAGLYTVTATDANGCSVIATLPVYSPNYLYATITPTNVPVYGQNTGSAASQVVGGRAPYQYLWSNGATSANISGLAAGVYTVTVTDIQLCTATRSVQITQPTITCSAYYSTFPWSSSIDLNLGIFEQVTGFDQFNWTLQSGATPTAQSGPDAAYHGTHYWYTKASGGNSPNKTAMLKTGKCLNLMGMANPVFEFYYHMYGNQMGSLSVQISQDNELNWVTVWTLSGNKGNAWNKAIINLLPYRSPHTKIRIVGTTGAGSRSDMAIDALYIGEAGNNQFAPGEETVLAPGMKVYPNPSTGWFELWMEEGTVCEKAEIFNAAGQLIHAENTSSGYLTFDLSGHTPGCYYLRVQSGGDVRVLKLMLTK